jgi:hypothetical protein
MYQVNSRKSNETQGTTPRRFQFQYILASVDVGTVDKNQGFYLKYHL